MLPIGSDYRHHHVCRFAPQLMTRARDTGQEHHAAQAGTHRPAFLTRLNARLSRTFVALGYACERSARGVSAPKVACQLIELAEYLVSELDVGGGERVVELVGSAGANDGRGDDRLLQH